MSDPSTTSFTVNVEDAPKASFKRGPGRPRKAESVGPTPVARPKVEPASATSADVKKAMATLTSGYNLLATGLLMGGLEESANAWVDIAGDLQKTNEDALKASPKLAKAIANAGSTGGSATFFITHGMALFSLQRIVSNELRERRASKQTETPESFTAETNQTTRDPFTPAPPRGPDFDPTKIPGT